MSGRDSARRAHDRAHGLAATRIFAAVLLSLVFLDHPGSGWSVTSRLGLVFAVVDHGTFAIDAYHETPPTVTYDKAYFEGHYYSDKMIGVSLLALPVYALLRGVGSLTGWHPDFYTSNYALRIFAVSLPAALSVVLLWLLMLRLGATPRRSLVAVGFAFWGSHWYGFSSSFFPYSAGIAAVLMALWLLLSRPLDSRRSFAIGALCGTALLFDMIFGLVVLGVATIFSLRLLHETGYWTLSAFGDPVVGTVAGTVSGPARPASLAARLLALGSLGGFIPLAIFMAYSISIFGTPTIPYEYTYLEGFREPMSQGFMGITQLKAGALWFLTLHPHRGVFFWSPWLLLTLAGFWLGFRAGGLRRLCAGLGAWTLVSYLVFNASYYMWWGGFAMGSRFLLPIFAVVPLALAEVLRRERSAGWFWALVVLGSVSVALSAPLSIVEPETPLANDYFDLLNVTLSSQLVAPQFAYLKAFYAPELFFDAEQGWAGGRIFALAGTALLPLALFVSAGRILGRDDSTHSPAPSPDTPRAE